MPAIINLGFMEAAKYANGKNITLAEATLELIANYRATLLFLRDGTPFVPENYKNGRIVEIGKSKYAAFNSKCDRCGGQGGWTGWPGFTCFKCGGSCWLEASNGRLYTADEIDRLDAIAARKEANRAEKRRKAEELEATRRAERIQELTITSDIYRALSAMKPGEFTSSLMKQMEDGKDLSGRQIEAVRNMIKRNEDAAMVAETSRHIGTIGERVELKAKVVFKTIIGEGFSGGVREMVKLQAEDGSMLVWFTEAGAPQVGAKVLLKATVKKHDEYKGVAQTVVTRCKFDFAGA